MPQFKILRSADIENALTNTKRQYLVGNLKLPQLLPHIHSEDIEIGISDYQGGEYEAAHFHTTQTEFQLVLWGATEYFDISSNKSFRFTQGDFYCIETNVQYAQIILEKTRILFIKFPTVNDKTLCEMSSDATSWLDKYQNILRK